MTLLEHVFFLLCVALAAGAQTLSGFAFGLLLLSLTSLLDIAPMQDVAIVISMMTLANFLTVFGWRWPALDWKRLMPVLGSSLVGVTAGLWLLHTLSGSMNVLLRILLGLTIVVCAFILVHGGAMRKTVSGRGAFASAGLVSGVLSGLFSASGPPLVYLLYRQPLPLPTVRNFLVIALASNAFFRLVMVAGTGDLTWGIMALSLEALPVVVGVTWLVRRYGMGRSVEAIRRLVCVLLVLSGLSLLVPGLAALVR